MRTGLVNSLAQPGGNVTGLSPMVPEVAAKRLGLLKEAIPGISRVLVLAYLADPIAPLQVKALEEAAHKASTVSLDPSKQLDDGQEDTDPSPGQRELTLAG